MRRFTWQEHYQIAKMLYDEIGTINVTAKYEYMGCKIGDWIFRQRTLAQKGKLSDEHKQQLDDLGINWDGRAVQQEKKQKQFDHMLELLEQYKHQYGDTRVPRNFMIDGQNLGNWTSAIRESLRGTGRYVLTSKQITALKQIGFEWDWYKNNLESNWTHNFDLVCEYADKFGVQSIIEGTEYKGTSIGNWLHYQREAFKKGKLNPDRYRKLSNIGFDFEPSSHQWDDAFALAQKYYALFHNLEVPNDYIIDGFSLGRWISNQRQIYNGTRSDMVLSYEQVEKLESIGIIWNSTGAGNTSFVEKAFYYYIHKIFDDAQTRNTEHGVELDIYIPSLYTAIEYDGSYWHQAKLNNDNDKDRKCKKKGIKLIRIREKPLPPTNGAICYFTDDKVTNSSLGELIATVIKKEFDISIDVNIPRDTNKISEEFQDHTRPSWYTYYLAAEEYYNLHKNLLIPISYISNGGLHLGVWISNQRHLHKQMSRGYVSKLSKKEISLLDSIGMVWDVRKTRWDYNFAIAQDYYNEFGNISVKSSLIYHHVKLGQWINGQRRQHNHPEHYNYSSEKEKLLESIGMKW